MGEPPGRATRNARVAGNRVNQRPLQLTSLVDAPARGVETLKAPLEEFVGYRVVVPDPPIGSRIMLEWRM